MRSLNLVQEVGQNLVEEKTFLEGKRVTEKAQIGKLGCPAYLVCTRPWV
jgi:hypothetical protein